MGLKFGFLLLLVAPLIAFAEEWHPLDGGAIIKALNEGDQFCSQWPPNQSRDCYWMERSTYGQVIRFLDAEGRSFVGKYVQ